LSQTPLRVAVVDDSSFVRRAIARMLEGDRRIEIVGLAASGEELLAHLKEWRPEAVTLDLSMPGMGGLQTLDQIMAEGPTAVIILSTHSAKDAPLTIEALHRGAMDFIDKQQYSLVDFQALRAAILEKLLAVRNVSLPAHESAEEPAKVSSSLRRVKGARRPPVPALKKPPAALRTATNEKDRRFEVLALGASTGGPPTLQRILEQLGSEVPVPVLVVQHMPAGFTRAFAERLNSYLPLQVREAQDGEILQPSTVYIGPAGQHFRLQRRGERLMARLSDEREGATHCPSVDVLFDSVARTCHHRALVALLTGMGRDGARGMKSVNINGGFTIAQDAASCVVYGMPKAAVAMRAVTEEVDLDHLGLRFAELLEGSREEVPSDNL